MLQTPCSHAHQHVTLHFSGRGSSVFNKSTFSLDAYHASDSVGKLAIYLLQRSTSPVSGGSAENGSLHDDAVPGQLSGMAHLERLASLLENYFHPSNDGK